MATIVENLEHVREQIAQAAAKVGRKANDIELVAITKTHDAEKVRAAHEAGQSLFGESRVQEARAKIPLLPGRARWIAELVALTVSAVFTAYMLWAVTRFVHDSYEFKEVAQGLIRVPIWIPQLSLVIGIAILFIALLDELVTVLRKRKPSYQVAEEARAAAGDFSEKL